MNALQFPRSDVLVRATGDRGPAIDGTVRVALDALAAGQPPIAAAGQLVARFGLEPRRAERQVRDLRDTLLAEGIDPRERDQALAVARQLAGSRLYRPCGQVVRVRYTSPGLLQRLHPQLAPSATGQLPPAHTIELGEADGAVAVDLDGAGPCRLPDHEAAMEHLAGLLVDLGHPELGWLARLRGAAVAAGDGALVLAGPPGAGVSTLAAGLVHAGLGHAGDGIVAIERGRGRVVPMPLALATRPGGWPALLPKFPELRDAEEIDWGGSRRRVLDLAGHAVPHHARPCVAALVFPGWGAAAEAALRTLTPLEALDRLLAARAWEPPGAEATRGMLAWLGRVPAYALHYDDLDDGIHLARLALAESCTLAA